MESSGKGQPVSAVLICSAGDVCDALVSSWRRFDVEFDCAAARVSMFRTNGAGRLAMRVRNAVARRLPPPVPPVTFFRQDQGR